MKKHCVKILNFSNSFVYSKWFYTAEEALKHFDECVRSLYSVIEYLECTSFCVMRFSEGILMFHEDILVGGL